MRTISGLLLSFLSCFSGEVLAQEICGGIIGVGCADPHDYCRLSDGECCCDFQGVCTPIPEACPATEGPVCGCDGVTYANRCQAAKLGVSVAHECACETPPPGPTAGVTGFDELARMSWTPVLEASGYNIYLAESGVGEPLFSCLYTDVPESSALLQGSPAIGSTWSFLVTAVTAAGEGPLGTGSACEPRHPTARCTCTLPPEPGDCDGVCPRWYYDSETHQCEEFVWGCCRGNANNFATAAQCEAACLDPCTQPAVAGPCDAAFLRWYHNVLTGTCETFVWGGCEGNANNFPSAETCAATCP
jgi:hypothetical protein